MRVLNELDRRAHRLGFVGVKLSSASALFAGFWVAQLFPDVLSVNVWWYVILSITLAIHPLIVVLSPDRGGVTTEGA